VRESAALRRQARSDIEAGKALGGAACPDDLRAHVVAKAQQAVEKVVKAAVVALLHGPKVHIGVVKKPTTNAHAPREHHVRVFAWAISRVVVDLAPRNNPIHRLANAFPLPRRLIIAELDVLVPEWPQGREKRHVQRNTEYPYEPTDAFDWVPPCDAFTAEETERFRNARDIAQDVDRLVDAIERVYP
jgi:hypothetical protein